MKFGMGRQQLQSNDFFNFLHSVIPTTRLLEVVRWNDDITHDPLRMRTLNRNVHVILYKVAQLL
jgi:hypothetical protein